MGQIKKDTTPPLGRVRSIAMSVSVDLYRCLPASWPHETVAAARSFSGGVIICTLGCTSGFADDVMFYTVALRRVMCSITAEIAAEFCSTIKKQHVFIVRFALGAKSAIELVSKLEPTQLMDWPHPESGQQDVRELSWWHVIQWGVRGVWCG